MKKSLTLIVLAFVALTSFGQSKYSKELYNQTSTFDNIETGKIVDGNLMKGQVEIRDTKVEFDGSKMIITDEDGTVVFTNIKHIATDSFEDLIINRFKCKNPNGDSIIGSYTNGMLSIVNIANKNVLTFTSY